MENKIAQIKACCSLFFRLQKKERWRPILYTGLFLLDTFLVLYIPVFSGKLINALVYKDTGAFFSIMILVTVLALLRVVVFYYTSKGVAFIDEKYGASLRQIMLRNIATLKVDEYTKKQQGDYISMLLNDTQIVKLFYSSIFIKITIGMIMIVGMLVILIPKNLLLTLLLLSVAPISIFLSKHYEKRISKRTLESQESLSVLTSKSFSWFSNFFLLKDFGLENIMQRQYCEKDNEYTAQCINRNNLTIFVGAINTFILSLPSIMIFTVGGISCMLGNISLGELFIFISFSTFFYAPIQAIIDVYNIQLSKYYTVMMRIHPFLSTDKNATTCIVKKEENYIIGEEVIKLPSIEYIYPGSERIIKIGDIFLPKGKLIGLSGLNGSGKTTFARVIGGVLSNKGNYMGSEFYNRVFIFTSPQQLFDGTLIDNITLFDPVPDLTRVNKIVSYLGIDKLINKIALFDYVDRNYQNRFSKGELQLIMLCRLFYTKKDIIILDEPEVSLDHEKIELVLEYMESMMNKYVLIISHNPYILGKCEKVYCISNKSVCGND